METMQAIETVGYIDSQRHLHVENALPVKGPGRVKVIVLLPEDQESDDLRWLAAAAQNPAFEFLKDPAEDIYTPDDGKPFSD